MRVLIVIACICSLTGCGERYYGYSEELLISSSLPYNCIENTLSKTPEIENVKDSFGQLPLGANKAYFAKGKYAEVNVLLFEAEQSKVRLYFGHVRSSSPSTTYKNNHKYLLEKLKKAIINDCSLTESEVIVQTENSLD